MIPVTVSIVLDPDFGDRVAQVAAIGPVWVTDSVANRAAVEEYWARKTPNAHQVTCWSEPRTGTTEEEWLGILDNIEVHHGEPWAGPGIAALEVYGVAPDEVARAALQEYGYEVTRSRSDGFTAKRLSDA
jgi:hypothetical protein